jgi:DNA-binding winged helix-turn-helix (wHTH) protein/tetratricopeptide (TPR) repeat protein
MLESASARFDYRQPTETAPTKVFAMSGEKQKPREVYEFGPFRADPEREILYRDGEQVSLTPKSFQTLMVFLRRGKEIVTKDELMKLLWPDSFVEEANLSRNVFMLRKALGESPQDHRYIVTVPGQGYRFAEEVRQVLDDRAVAPATNPAPAPVRFVRSDRRRWVVAVAVLLAATGIALGFLLRRPGVLSEKDTVVLAEFANSTGDPVFDGALREGLSVQLEQSPFLKLISEERIKQTLGLMGQPAEAKLSPEIAREICQRTASAAVLDGSITQIGTQYLLTLKVVNCATGESLASAGAQANDKNHVLDALGKTASEIRNKLGESLSTVQKFDTPLEQATTPSLEALKAFSLGHKLLVTSGDAEAIPFYKRAIELDPNFALAYAWMGLASTDIGQPGVAANYTRKAYAMRDRTSEPEKYFILTVYHKEVIGNIRTAEQTCELWMQAYPRSEMPRIYLSGAIYPAIGQYEKAVERATEAIRLNPDNPIPYAFAMSGYVALNRLDEAKAIHDQALQRKLDHPFFYAVLYQIAFLQGHAEEMAQQLTRSAGQPGAEDQLMSLQADTAAYFGRIREARERSRRAMDSAERSGEKEAAATYSALSGLREALFGNAEEARRRASSAMERSAGRDVQYGAALALAYAGDDGRARTLAGDLDTQFPEDTIVQFNFLPILRAKLALNRRNVSDALEGLRAATPYELGVSTDSPLNWTALYPVFVRGEVYLAAHQGKEAAAEFQKILDHWGMVLNEPIGALAHLGLARAHVLQGDTVKARAAYQDFLTLWKDAEPDLPILKQAKKEYAELH